MRSTVFWRGATLPVKPVHNVFRGSTEFSSRCVGFKPIVCLHNVLQSAEELKEQTKKTVRSRRCSFRWRSPINQLGK